jgi:hypothetical protein
LFRSAGTCREGRKGCGTTCTCTCTCTSTSTSTEALISYYNGYIDMTADSTIELEEGGSSETHCACCGKVSQTVHGYLYDANGRTSVYFIRFSEGHVELLPDALLCFGGWGEGGTPSQRISLSFKLELVGNSHVELRHYAPEDSPWFGEEQLGQFSTADRFSESDLAYCSRLMLFVVGTDIRVRKFAEQTNKPVRG